jgi:hypothetical protein
MQNDQIKQINQYYNISQELFEATGAFNAVIGVDRPFFLDATLLKKCTIPEFQNAHKTIEDYFSGVVTLIKGGSDIAIRKAIRKMTLRELRGVGIGYGSKTDDGSAIGPELAKRLVAAAKDLIAMGFDDPAIFELMGIFEEDFGADRISDAVINILQTAIYVYTIRLAGELNIECSYKVIDRLGDEYILPTHPTGNKALLLVPRELLRSIPIALTPEDIPYVSAYNEQLREKFNTILSPIFAKKDNVTKDKIKTFLFEEPKRFAALLKGYKEANPESYDFDVDPEGLQRWIGESNDAVQQVPVEIPNEVKTDEELEMVVGRIVSAFKRFIETKGGWRGLYGPGNKPLHEEHACLLFYAISLKYCEESNIDISPQSNAGRGPVDFKLSRGGEKIIAEVKLTSGSVYHGYKVQTRIYQNAEDAKHAYYLVVQVTETSKALERVIKQAEQEESEGVSHPEVIHVDGRPRESASNAKELD